MGLKITNRTETIASSGSGAIDLNLDSIGGGNVVLDGQSFPNAIGSANDVLTVSGGVLTWVAPAGGGVNLDSYRYTDVPAINPTGSGAGSLIIGDGADGSTFDNVVVIGNTASATGNNAVAVGRQADALGVNSTAIGENSDARGSSSVAVGDSATVNPSGASSGTAVGNGANVASLNATAIGNSAVVGATSNNSVAIGNAVNVGAGNANEVHIGTSATNKFRLKADGTLSVEDTLNYETLVTVDDDIPNKKYVDDNSIGSLLADPSPQISATLDTNGNNISFDNGSLIQDNFGNEQLRFLAPSSVAVNFVELTNGTAGNAPQFVAAGETNVDLRLSGKGTGVITVPAGYETNVTNGDDIPNKQYVDDITKVYRIGHTYAISGEIKVPAGDTDFIIPFFYSAATGQTASIVKARHSINGGTSATVKLQRNGADITGYTSITVNTTPSDTTQTQALSDNDEIALVVTAVSAAPMNMNFTIFIEYTQ